MKIENRFVKIFGPKERDLKTFSWNFNFNFAAATSSYSTIIYNTSLKEIFVIFWWYCSIRMMQVLTWGQSSLLTADIKENNSQLTRNILTSETDRRVSEPENLNNCVMTTDYRPWQLSLIKWLQLKDFLSGCFFLQNSSPLSEVSKQS